MCCPPGVEESTVAPKDNQGGRSDRRRRKKNIYSIQYKTQREVGEEEVGEDRSVGQHKCILLWDQSVFLPLFGIIVNQWGSGH